MLILLNSRTKLQIVIMMESQFMAFPTQERINIAHQMDSAMQRCSQPQNIDLKNIHLNIKLLHSQHSHCTILLQKRKTPTLPFSRFSLLGEGGEKMKPFPLVHKKEKAHRDWLWSPEISSFTSIYTAPVLCSDWLLFESIHVKITWLSPAPLLEISPWRWLTGR